MVRNYILQRQTTYFKGGSIFFSNFFLVSELGIVQYTAEGVFLIIFKNDLNHHKLQLSACQKYPT